MAARACLFVLAVIIALAAAVGAARRVSSATHENAEGPSDTLVASIRAEPRSFNRYVSRDLSTTVLTYLMHGTLVRINRVTNRLEPELADHWELLADRRTYRLSLRRNVRFSDGTPFSAADVVFSFRAVYDKTVDSVFADSLTVLGRPLDVSAEDDFTVRVRFPSAFGPGLRMLDGIPIYPRRLLAPALEKGTFRSAWGLSTQPAEMAGLGPFVLRRYEPGERLTFDRNPYYWRRESYPTLSRLVLEVVTDQDAELLRLETGTIDITQSELRPSDVPPLKRAAADGRVVIADAGIGLDGDLLWMNLTPGKTRDARSRWLQHADFRKAIASAIDRQAFVNTVYLGAAVPADSIVSPGNSEWHQSAPPPAYDPAGARRLLASLGLRDRGNGTLEDAGHHEVRFTLLTQKGNTSLERGAWVIRDSVAPLGIRVDVIALEPGALVDSVMRGDYDAAYFRLLTTDTDPALNLDFWLSSGSAHVWNPGERAASTRWEAAIDALMTEVAAAQDSHTRHARFGEVQRIMAAELPVICFAFPRLSIAMNARVAAATPAAFRPPVLWNPAVISVSAEPSASSAGDFAANHARR